MYSPFTQWRKSGTRSRRAADSSSTVTSAGEAAIAAGSPYPLPNTIHLRRERCGHSLLLWKWHAGLVTQAREQHMARVISFTEAGLYFTLAATTGSRADRRAGTSAPS